jgi:hypothetical protein
LTTVTAKDVAQKRKIHAPRNSVEQIVSVSRLEQGLPPTIGDFSTISRIAVLLSSQRGGPPQPRRNY